MQCDIARCRDCSPGLLVPVSPLLEPGKVRLTMSWGERPLDLDVYAQQRNINTEESCTTYYGKKLGVTASLWIWTMSMQDSVYMLFAHHYGSTRDTEELGPLVST